MRILKRIEFQRFGYEGMTVGIGCGVYVEAVIIWSDGGKEKKRFYIGDSIDFSQKSDQGLSVVPPEGGEEK